MIGLQKSIRVMFTKNHVLDSQQNRLSDIICEKVPYCGTNIVGPDQTPRIMRGV